MTKILIDEATVKLALEALKNTTPTGFNMERDKQFFAAITALREALAGNVKETQKFEHEPAQQALDKKAENARELGLDYEPAQQEPAGWRPATFHRDNLSFNPGFPDEQTVKFWKMQGVEIEYCYTSPLLLSLGATLYTSPPAQRTWVGLTYEEAKEIYTCIHGYDSSKRIAQAIEAKLKEKNT